MKQINYLIRIRNTLKLAFPPHTECGERQTISVMTGGTLLKTVFNLTSQGASRAVQAAARPRPCSTRDFDTQPTGTVQDDRVVHGARLGDVLRRKGLLLLRRQRQRPLAQRALLPGGRQELASLDAGFWDSSKPSLPRFLSSSKAAS